MVADDRGREPIDGSKRPTTCNHGDLVSHANDNVDGKNPAPPRIYKTL